jgi:hypothetical protein
MTSVTLIEPENSRGTTLTALREPYASALDLLKAARVAEIHCRHALALMVLQGDADEQQKARRQLDFVSAVIAKATGEAS